jgi:DNA-binding NarL/FixJ family response regulator
MTAIHEIVLISADLMFATRLEAVLRPSGVALRTRPTRWPYESTGAVVVDLNDDAENRLALIADVRARDAAVPIVGFCEHQEKQRRTAAMAAGATQVVTNGSLQAVALRLIGAAIP